MKAACSSLFHLSPESWLGKRLDGDWQMMVISPKEALAYECKPRFSSMGDTMGDQTDESDRR